MLYFIFWLLITLSITSIALGFAIKHGSPYVIGLYVAALASAIVIAGKIGVLEVFGQNIALSASIVVFSATFLITDVLAEVYGKAEAKKAIWAGAALYPILYISIYFSVGFTPDAFYSEQGLQDAYSATMDITGRVIIASFLAFIFGQLHDVWAFHFLKEKTNGKHLWLRNNVSTWGSQLIDTVIFYTIAFYGVIPLFDIIVPTYIAKIFIAIIDTPFVYGVVSYIRTNKQIEK
jgi:queuosine precursor transporter